MNAILRRELKALKHIAMCNGAALTEGYITAYRAYLGGELLLYVYVDFYQLVRDWRGLPDLVEGLGRNNWNVDRWEDEKRVVFWGDIKSSRQFRQVIVAARKVADEAQSIARRIYPKGRREWVVRA